MKKFMAIAAMLGIVCTFGAGCESSGSLSKPVAVTADGDVDMEVALSYQTDIDALLEKLDAKAIDATDTVSENTNAKTQAVFDFLRENYGTNMISGQQMFDEDAYEDVIYYYETGDLPAIKGFDFIFATSSGDTSDIDRAIDWHNNSGGLVSFCWHWNVPVDITKPDGAKAFYSKEITNFSLANAVTPGTAEYEQVIHDIDLIAIQLQRLEAAGVPVIWRPLHEASGSWFWWGAIDRETVKAEYYQKLWYILYDRLENYHKLTNLIWLWNGQNGHMCVNANTYDIAGTDVYPSSLTHSAQTSYYEGLSNITESGKMLTLSECGYIPDIKDALETGSMWLYYMPWYGDFVYKVTGKLACPVSLNPERIESDFIRTLFADENVITWSELPQWEGTEKNLPIAVLKQFPGGVR